MKKSVQSIEFEREGLSCSVKENIAVMNLTCGAFESLANAEKDMEILDWFDLVEASESVKGVLIINKKDCLGEQAYNDFLSELAGKKLDINNPEAIRKFEKSQARAIEINMLMNFIRRIVTFNKIFIIGLRGNIVTPFLGMSLAMDFRIIDQDTTFSFSHVKYSLHPSGALPFFLPKYIGQGRAVEYMLEGGRINADEALNLGIANKIIAVDSFEEICIKEAVRLCSLNPQYVKITKSLVYNYINELNKFFDLESNYIFG